MKEDEEKLGPLAVAWWNKLLDEKDFKPVCEKCHELMAKWQGIHPHQDQENVNDIKRDKRNAVTSFSVVLSFVRKLRMRCIDEAVRTFHQLKTLHYRSTDVIQSRTQNSHRHRGSPLWTSI